MSRDQRKECYGDWDRDWGRPDYRGRIPRKRTRSRSPQSRDRIVDKRPSRSPRKNDILNEIYKFPEPSELWEGNLFQGGGFCSPPRPPYPPGQQEYGSNYQPSYSGIYDDLDDFPALASVPQSTHMPDMSAWNQMLLPSPQPPVFPPAVFNVEGQIKKEDLNLQKDMSAWNQMLLPPSPQPRMHPPAVFNADGPRQIKKDEINLQKHMSAWNQMSLPPPPQAPMHPPAVFNVEDKNKKEAAIELEMRHQKAALSKQREEYIKEASLLKKELDTLKDQRNELHGDPKRSPSPDTKRFLKENSNLQLEIQNKLKTINNVVDMLNGIIGEEAQVPESEDLERTSKRKSRSPSNPKCNYVYYDPEMHWCRVCNEFPPSAKDYLNHLHSTSHHEKATAHMKAPWHNLAGVNEPFPTFSSAPTKRTPIRGLQFFEPSTAWYCKLCDQFIGDLHCASAHLKSIVHSKNYINFVEQNPHWEIDWMSDRQKAFEKSRASNRTEENPQYTSHSITNNKDRSHIERKDSPTPTSEGKKKDKKERSNSCSSSSNSSSSDSEPVKKKKPKSKKDKSEMDPDDKRLTEWMSSIQMDMLNESDRELLHTLKSKMKTEKQKNAEKRHSPDRHDRADIDRKIRESERESRAREERNRRDELRRRDERREERREDRREERRDDRRGERRDDRREERRNDKREERRESRRDERRDDKREEKREDRREERRDDRRGERRDDRREERRPESRSRASPSRDAKKPEVKKMPFIGKMPVHKHLGKTAKLEEQKKVELKKKDEEGNDKKRRDAEIQKKVAEFQEKIAQLERERQQADKPPAQALTTQSGDLTPPSMQAGALAPPSTQMSAIDSPPTQTSALDPPPTQTSALDPLPTQMGVLATPPAQTSALDTLLTQTGVLATPPTQTSALDTLLTQTGVLATPPTQTSALAVPPVPAQHAANIQANIPNEVKPDLNQPMPGQPQFPVGMPPFPGLGILGPPPMPPMIRFGINAPLFPRRPQLYDRHVPIVPNANKQRYNNNKRQRRRKANKQANNPPKTQQEQKENRDVARKKEELDDLAMLGIDASDVGAGI